MAENGSIKINVPIIHSWSKYYLPNGCRVYIMRSYKEKSHLSIHREATES